MPVRDYFSDAELAAVREATEDAEKRTAGELVCVVVERSDHYEDARWRAATLGALAGALIAAYGFYAIEAWEPSFFVWPAVLTLVGIAAGWLVAVAVPAVERELAGAEAMRDRVHHRAATAFVSEKVFRTRDRTGLLIFLSLFERRVEILCDEGIRDKVPDEAWSKITHRLATGIDEGRAGSALVEAIEACGNLLAESGVERADDDVNELADGPRLSDE
ncbi:MAG: TPM domain-containing protein [Acidobacteria bacterium]|nr:TPM domain-containing protein [Acidobacteriota bacterium]MCZ6726023.1 TPM domain-containing protein [Acidobacteriota bacterium]